MTKNNITAGKGIQCRQSKTYNVYAQYRVHYWSLYWYIRKDTMADFVVMGVGYRLFLTIDGLINHRVFFFQINIMLSVQYVKKNYYRPNNSVVRIDFFFFTWKCLLPPLLVGKKFALRKSSILIYREDSN